MVYAKRLLICVVLGFVTGVLCYLAAQSKGIEFTPAIIWSTIFNRVFIGFAIGISAWRMHYLIHGVVIGILFSLPMAFAASDTGGCGSFFLILIAGAVWGFLIELFATAVFKAPMKVMQASE